jgi:hypothetical protein
MGHDARKKKLTRRAVLRRLALVCFGAISLATGASASAGTANPPALVSVDRLLAKVKAEHPRARVLKAELLPAEEGSGRDWLYEVKIFPPDGRILKLVYDARTLALLEQIGGGGGPHQRRLRLRRGWRGGSSP